MEKEIINQKLEIKCLFFIFLIVLSFKSQGQVMQKCPAYPDTIRIAQQENYFLECFIKGDEYFSLITTVDGFALIENKEGKLEYAMIDSTGKINSTGVLAKNTVNRTVEEISLLKTIDKKAIERIRPTSSKMSVSSDLNYSIESFPTSGTRNLLVLLIDFTDLSFQIANNNFNNLMNQANYNGTGSFKDYWLESSYSNLTVNSTVRGWYHAANNMAYYGANSGGSDVNPRLLVQEAVDAAENAGIDFSIYDNDNDGNVDGIIVIHAGYGEEAGGGANTIWSHHWTLGSYKRTYDGVTIDDYAIVSELRNNFGSNISNIGVICHEFGHSLGLPDLYDTDASNGNSEGIGEWGLMGSGNWNNNGASPSNLCAWSKVFLSWSNPVVLSSPTSISLPNSAQNNILYKVNTPHANEYFILENRQLIGFDIGLPGTGLAIWHINTSKTTTSHINANDVNADENLKGVDLEEADGSLDLDNSTNRGDDGDLFPGTSCNISFKDNTTPDSRTYSPIVNTYKPIINIVESGNNIRFDFWGYNPISGSSNVCSSGATFTVSNIDTTAFDSIIWSTGPYLTDPSVQNTDSCTVSATGNGESWVQVRLVNECGSITLPQKIVWAGEQHELELYCEGRGDIFTYAFYVNPVYEYDSIVWGVYPAPAEITDLGGGYATIRFDEPGIYDIWAYVINGCGPGTPAYIYDFYVYDYLMSPNPASTEVEITISAGPEEGMKSASLSSDDEYTVTILDNYGVAKIQQKYYGKKFTVPVSSLKDGNYFVRISNEKLNATKQLIIKR